MPKLTVDTREVSVPPGATLLDAARSLGIRIPALCYADGLPPHTSCLVCVVKVHGLKRLVPACAFPARDGLVVESDTPEVHAARRTALELLMGDHLGDCVGPCVSICPTKMDIPRLMDHLRAGRIRDALITAKEMMALPAILGHVCPAPCENGCRRALVDEAVAIRDMHRFAAEADLASDNQYLPECAPKSGKSVAIIGAGPAGLSAAWYLLQQGHAMTIYDDRDEVGGQLRYGVEPSRLPRAVLDGEVGLVAKLGAQFRMQQRLGVAFSLADVRRDHDAVLLAFGDVSPDLAAALDLPLAGKALKMHGYAVPSPLNGIFAAGSAIAPSRFAVRAVASGRAAALTVGHFLAGKPQEAAKDFVIHMGKLDPEELQVLMASVNSGPKLKLPSGATVTVEQGRAEAARCLQCGCLKEKSCRLRQYATEYGAQAAKYKGDRRRLQLEHNHPDAVHEPGKCIACGVCASIAKQAGEPVGLAMARRGFNVRVTAPFNKSFADALQKSAAQCAAACPTAAIALRRKPS
jgi:NADPH-dependent glutamate synthase beta subunit-like oxidoreductase